MGTVLTAIGWLAALALAEITLSALTRIFIVSYVRRWRGKTWMLDGYWLTPLLFGGPCILVLALLGAIPLLPGAPLGMLLLLAAAAFYADALVRAARRGEAVYALRRIRTSLVNQAWGGWKYLRDDARNLLHLLRGQEVPDARDTLAPPPAATPEPADSPAPREVPSLRDDDMLGPPPAVADVAAGLMGAGVPVPAAWAALCESVAGFEPDTDEDLIAHVAGEAAGILTYADAVRVRAETLLHGTGLDPAYVAGHYEFADEFADLASAVALVDKRFSAIYGAIREWVGDGGILPHNAKQWFSGGPGAPDAGTSEDEAA
jgi:hypothetical protein